MNAVDYPLRIVIAIERYWPATGGAEQYARTIAHLLAEAGHHVTVVPLVRDDLPLDGARLGLTLPHLEPENDGKVHVAPLPISRAERAQLLPLLLRKLTERSDATREPARAASRWYFAQVLAQRFARLWSGAHIVHSVAPWEMSWLAQAAARRIGIPHVVTGLLHPGNWADDRWSTGLFRSADAVVALLETERQAYLRAGLSPERVVVCGFPPRAIRPIGSSPVARSRQHPVVLFLGAKRWYKGWDVLLRAAPLVWRHEPGTVFQFVGPRTPESARVFAATRDPRIIELGTVSDSQRDEILLNCDVVCLPSATEILPNVILEAWVAAKPVIVSAIPPLQELVGDAGLCVDRDETRLAEAIVRVVCEPLLADQLGNAGRAKLERTYSPVAVESRLTSLYRHLIR